MSDIKNEAKADASGDKLDAIMSLLGKVIIRQDEMEAKSNLPAKSLEDASGKSDAEKEEEAKKDAEEEKMRKDAKAKKDDDAMADEAKALEEKAKMDAEGKKEGEFGAIKFDEDKEEEDAKNDAAFADCQAKADSVYSAFGKSAPRAMSGENLTAYRKRMVRGLQAHSDEMKNVNINLIKDDAMLDVVENRVYSDALTASRGTSSFAKGQLVEIKKVDQAGRTVTEFRGDMAAWLDDFKAPTQRVIRFNTENVKR